MYHGFLALDFGEKSKNFNENILMGVFGADGVERNNAYRAMPFNTLLERSVHFHDISYSPPNAEIDVSSGRKISTFFGAAISPNKNRVAVSYHMLVNEADLQQNISNSCKNATQFDQLLDGMEQEGNALDGQDKVAVQNFVANMRKVLAM